jgi:predicted dehydrogenase
MQTTKRSERCIRIGQVGTGVMALAHSIAYSNIPQIFNGGIRIQKKIIADKTNELAKSGAERLGYEKWTNRWEEVVESEEVDVVDICTPNDLHMPIALASAKNGKHIICEKPLALTAQESKSMYDAVKDGHVKHCVAFNYRMTPAVLEAKKIIETGTLGEIFHFRGSYLQDFAIDKQFPLVWRFKSNIAGTGSLGDIGSHIIDYARFLVGEPIAVVANNKTFIKERPIQSANRNQAPKTGTVDVDDAVSILMQFSSGAMGTIEASRFYHGRKNQLSFEISGSKGSVYFDWERRNELQFYSSEVSQGHRGFTKIITGPDNPYGGILWPIPGLGMSYIETTNVLLHQFILGVLENRQTEPNFYDGFKTAVIMDAVLVSDKERKWIEIGSH